MSDRPDAAWWPLLWDAGVVALAVLGPDRRYRAVNDACCRLLEADAATLLGWSYERVGHPLDLDVELDAFVRLAEGAGAATYTRRFRSARAREFTATVQAVPGADGALLQVIIPTTVTSVATAPPRHAAALEQVAAALSHDAQEPVRQLGVSAGLLMERLEPVVAAQERERSLLEGMERNAVRLNRQIRALVRFARLGTPVPDPVPRPLRQVVDAALAQVPIPAHVRIEDTVPATLLLRCDRAQLTTALGELLRNAIAAHAPGRPTLVQLAAVLADGWVTISVRDDGVGIAAVDQPRLFRLLAASGPGAGAGVGLAVVRAIAEGHGGEVRLESVQGRGTTVSLVLPA